MLETAWESRWLPDQNKKTDESLSYRELVLPVIREDNGKLLFLVTDKTVRCVQGNAPREQVRSVVCTHTIQMSLKALMKASFQRTVKHICALYIENRILIKILKYQKSL